MNELNAVTCPACGTVYRGAAVEKVTYPGWWSRGEDGGLLQPAQCLCGAQCVLPRPDLGANVALVSTSRGARPVAFTRATRTLYVSDSHAYHRSGPRAGHERGQELGGGLWTGEAERLELWALSLGGAR